MAKAWNQSGVSEALGIEYAIIQALSAMFRRTCVGSEHEHPRYQAIDWMCFRNPERARTNPVIVLRMSL